MDSKASRIARNRPPYHILDVGNKKKYYDAVLDKFIDEFLSPVPPPDNDESCPDAQDKIRNYSLCLLKYYFIFNDFKDAAREGNGETLAILHKQLLLHFKALSGFNAYAIQMMISIVQNEALLSEAESHHCMWVATVNWKGGHGKNIEIDLQD